MRYKAELPEMTSEEQGRMLFSYLREESVSRQRQDVMAASGGSGELDVAAKLAYVLCCQTIIVLSINKFSEMLRLVYLFPPFRFFCDFGKGFMKEMALVVSDLDIFMNNNYRVDYRAVDRIAEYVCDIPSKIRHIRIRMLAAIVVMIDVVLIVGVSVYMLHH